MMNQTKKHTTSKKLLALLLALIMTVSLLPMSVFAAAVDVPETEPQINYVEKTQSVPLKDGTFYRIVHIDCGRKYFSVTDLKKIIDYAAASNYTHVELAFGNDGLRFLLDDMEVTASGVTYASEDVKSAIQAGNAAFSSAGELTQTEMNGIISYAKTKGIGIIPMFDAPGHLQAVIRAMKTLNISMVEKTDYCLATKSGTSYNWALIPTNVEGNNFVQELVQKYINYFKTQGCTMFNIAADECGFSYNSDTRWSGMSNEQYTAYARFVNSMAARVQNAGMVALAFNDGIYHKNLTTSVDFDTNIAVCYWDASEDKYASASDLATKGFKIINTNNKWYYVLGSEGTGWFGYEWAQSYMNGSNKDCRLVDGGYYTDAGCMLALWCDNPSANVNWTNVKNHIKTLSDNNKDYFTEVKAPEEVKIVASATSVNVGDTVTLSLSDNSAAEWSSSDDSVLKLNTVATYAADNSVTATAIAEGDATVTATVGDNKYTQDITVQAADEIKVTEERTINLTIGQTATDVIENHDYHGSYTTEKPEIATVVSAEYDKVEGKREFTAVTPVNNGKYYIQDANGKYLKLTSNSLSWVADTDSPTEWTVTVNTDRWGNATYEIKNGNYYLRWRSSGLTTSNNRQTLYFNDGQFCGTRSNSGLGYTYSNYFGTPGTLTITDSVDQTTITFEGVAEGTTYVTIGHVRYTIIVTAEKLDGVSPLPIQLWTTNNTIEVDGTSATKTGDGWGGNAYYNGAANYVSVSAKKAYGEKGIPVIDAIGLGNDPLDRYEWGGTRAMKAHSTSEGDIMQQVSYWCARVHDSSNMQTVWGNDYSNSGTEFNYVRYYLGKWQVSADRIDWTTVTGAGSTGSKSGCTQQLAAYYMIRTEITDEVTTEVADWGEPEGSTNYDTLSEGNFVLLDFAVKYESSNTRVPNKFPVDGKTLAYHCKNGDSAVGTKNNTDYRMLNNFRGVNTGEYEVYKVTVTMTSDATGTTLTSSAAQNSYSYDGEEQILWAIDQETLDQSGLDPYAPISGSTTYAGCKIGGDPYIRGIEVYNKHGALITYYVRAKETPDSLHVYYIDESQDNYQFYDYVINVKKGTYFDENIALNTDTSKATPAWKTDLVYGSVENIKGETETVTADLSKMPAIGAQYRYADYECTHIKREDGNNLYLYYKFSAVKTFVVDFGLPLTITTKDINSDLENARQEGRLIRVVTGNSQYATVKTADNYSITYTLNKAINGKDNVTANYYGRNSVDNQVKEVTYTLSIIPASTVYYEDSFATFYDAGSADAKTAFDASTGADKMGQWYVEGTEQSAEQALEVLGEKKNVYGYDEAYKNSTTFSMGSAHKVTVDASVTTNPTATFTFKGTGFDVISLTDNTSGAIFVDVYKGKEATGDMVKSYIVDNYYGYKQETVDGETTWVVDKDSTNCLYQIPVMKVSGLDYGEYTAVITVFYNGAFDHTKAGNSYSFWLDAIRVYDPMGENADYAKDGEGWPQYIKLRDKLAKSEGVTSAAVFIDGGETADITVYANYGPNNEVYLAKGQAISFKVPNNDKIVSVQIGAKAPQGSAQMSVEGATLDEGKGSINTATEMYYVLNNAKGSTVTITNNGDGILSLTNLKFTFSEKQGTVTLQTLSDEEQANAVAAVRALFAAPVEPEPAVFEPERFEASWNRSSVRAGEKATLTVKTSEDVAAITVDGVTIDTYRTRTQRTGWGWNAKKVTYREFTYTITASETADHAVTAVSAEGTASETIHAVLTVRAAAQRPGAGGWLSKLFSRWF